MRSPKREGNESHTKLRPSWERIPSPTLPGGSILGPAPTTLQAPRAGKEQTQEDTSNRTSTSRKDKKQLFTHCRKMAFLEEQTTNYYKYLTERRAGVFGSFLLPPRRS